MQTLLKGVGRSEKNDIKEQVRWNLCDPDTGPIKEISQEYVDKNAEYNKKQNKPG